MGSFVRISVTETIFPQSRLKKMPMTTALIWADILAGYALWVMITYLTNVWKLNFTHAAAIVNFSMGAANIMPIVMAFLVHAFMSDFWMLLLSSLAFSFGLSFLAMSMPPVLSKSAGNCSAYKSDCIGNTQKVLFYMALALIAVGLAGHMTSLKSFLDIQKEDQTENDQMNTQRNRRNEPDQNRRNEPDKKEPWRIVGASAVILFSIIGAIALPYVKPWSVRFGIPAICTVVATLLFLSGSCSYKRDRLRRRPFRPLFEITIRTIPMWMTFIMCGVVSSIGNTYFLEQANNMNRKVGHLKVPLQIFLIFHEMAKSVAACIIGKDDQLGEKASTGGSAGKVFQRQPSKIEKGLERTASTVGILGRKSGKKASTIGFVLAMMFSILCCIAAAKVETRRLDVIKRHGFLDKPQEKIPMSMFWLLPQFLLLGALDGLFEKSIDRFISDHVPQSRYLKNFSSAITGTGIMGSVLIVYIAGKVSGRGGKPSWFQDTLNKSHLDNYYWMLSALSSINLFFFILVSICCPYRESESRDNAEAQGNGETAEY